MTWLPRLYYATIAGLEEERGEEKKVEEGSPPSYNDGLVHRPVSPVWQETLSSWSAVTLVCQGQCQGMCQYSDYRARQWIFRAPL